MGQIKTAAGLMIDTFDEEAKRGRESERQLAIAVRSLMQDDYPHGAGVCGPANRRIIDADAELSAFFAKVALAGAWAEERMRVARNRPEAPPRRDPNENGCGPLTTLNIGRVIPLWRKWGRLLIDAEAAKAAGGLPGANSGGGGDGGGQPPAPEPDAAMPDNGGGLGGL